MSMSVFADAITQSMVASMDPMNVVVRRMFEGQAEQAQLQLDEQRVQFIENLRGKLQKAKEDGEDAAVVDGYRRLIDKHSNKAA